MGRHSPSRKKVQEKQQRARSARAAVREARAQQRAGGPVAPPVDPAFRDDADEGDLDEASGALMKMRGSLKTVAGTDDDVPAKRKSPLLGVIVAVVVVAAIVGFVLASI